VNRKIKAYIIGKYDEKFGNLHILPMLKSNIEFLPCDTKPLSRSANFNIASYLFCLFLASVTVLTLYRGFGFYANASREMSDLRTYELELGTMHMLFGCASLVVLCFFVAKKIKRR